MKFSAFEYGALVVGYFVCAIGGILCGSRLAAAPPGVFLHVEWTDGKEEVSQVFDIGGATQSYKAKLVLPGEHGTVATSAERKWFQ